MKQTYRILGLIFVLFALSCDLDKDLNDPNEVGPDSADPTLLLNAVQADFADFFTRAAGNLTFGPASRGVDQLMRMKAMTGGDNYETAFLPQNLDEIWQSAYQKVLVNIEAMLPLAEEKNLTTHVAVAKILKAYIYLTLVDLWGDVPQAEAIKGSEGVLNPATTDGATIYNMAIGLLGEARTELAKTGTDAGAALTRDIYYGGSRAKWTTLANSIELKAQLNMGNATAVSALITADDLIDTDAEEFTYKYGTANIPSRSRHPLYRDYYAPQLGAAGGYTGNYFMKEVFNGTGVQDPRWRYYFYRQVGSIAQALSVDNESVPCVNQQGVPQNKPIHYINTNSVFCVFEPGFFGRDHGDDDGGPPDSNVITCTGAYPAGGRVDTNPTGPTGDPNFWAPTQQGQGGNGAGIDPIFMSWFTDFMKAEAVLRLGVAGDAKALMVSGANKSINRARSFANSLGQTVPSSIEPSQIAYISNLEALYDASSDKLDVAMKEFYKSLYGNGLEAYNMYRRTSSPKNIQPVRAPNPGVFYRSLIYPANFVNLNNSTSQKATNDIKVFWDTNPDVLK
jgi:hypothetical protein